MTGHVFDVAYADSTSLIALARLGRLELLSVIADEIRVTEAVWGEVADDSAKPGFQALLSARREGLFVVVDEGDPFAFAPLGRGESSVLSAASVARAVVIIDERQARLARDTSAELRERIPDCVGILGILVRAKQLGRIERVRPIMDALIDDGFRVSPALRLSVLTAVNE